MGRRAAAKAQVPMCRFEAACTRSDCIYRHPPKPKKAALATAKAAAEASDKVCFAYVAGRCQFAKYCRDKHPDEASCRTIRERYAIVDCQWGAHCKTEGCLYRHPTNAPAGPPLQETVRAQPAVFAEGPVIVPVNAFERSRARPESIPIPKALLQSADLRNPAACSIVDPLERFLAVNAHNCGSKSAALLDFYFQSALTCQSVLDDVLPERLRMFSQGTGVWIVTGSGSPSRGHQRLAEGSLFEAVRDYLSRCHYDFSTGHDADGSHCAFCVFGRRKVEDPLLGIRAVVLCGLPGSGKTALAEALARKSGGRFRRVSQDDQADRSLCERAWRSELSSAAEAAGRSKAGSWWWDHAFSSDRHYLVVCLRTPLLKILAGSNGLRLPSDDFLHATLAYQPTALDLRRWLGRPVTISLRSHLVLECVAAPHTGEIFEAILCVVRERSESGSVARPATTLHIPLTAPRTAARNLQVLNAMPVDKKIMANTIVGSFKVKQVTDLQRSADLSGLCVLMHKTGDLRDTPVGLSFDAAALNTRSAADGDASTSWTEIGDAALRSLDSIVVLADGEDSAARWTSLVAERCARIRLPPPQLQVLRRPPQDTKVAQWMRLRSKCLLHCTADEADIPLFLNEGAAVLRHTGGATLPPLPSKEAKGAELPRIAVLDRCNLERADRKQWLESGNLAKSEVIAVYFDVSEVPSHIVRLEPPSEHEGFRAVVRLKATATASLELVRKWTEEQSSEHPRRLQQPSQEEEDVDDSEYLPPANPMLSQWIEVQEQVGNRPPDMWGMPLDDPVDFPLDLLPGNYEDQYTLGPTCPSSASNAPGTASGDGSWGSGSELHGQAAPLQDEADQHAHYDALLMGSHERPSWQKDGYPAGPAGAGASGLGVPWPGSMQLEHHGHDARGTSASTGAAATAMANSAAVAEEDEEERAREEQLAATLRCMGFDEEPSLLAAQRAGGNLNVAVERMLRGSGTSGE